MARKEGLVDDMSSLAYFRCSQDPIYFISQFCYTFDPRTEQKDLKFELYDYQKEYATTLVEAMQTGHDLFTEKSRDMGVSWLTLAVLLWFYLFTPSFQVLLGSRKEEYVDDWTMKSLFPKLEYMLKRLPKQFIPHSYERTYMKLVNPQTGSTISGESANANFSRAGRYNVILFDELAFWPWSQSSWEAAGDATPCRIAVTTPSAMPSYAKGLRLSGKTQVITLHWRLHPHKDEAWYEAEKARRTSEEIARELDINWEGAITGRVYPEIEQVRIGQFPYMPQWSLYVSHDFGHHPDPHSIGWFQVNPETGQIRLLETFERSNKIIDWFVPLFGQPIDSQFAYTSDELTMIRRVGVWKKAIHFGDPAGRSRNEVSGTSVIDALTKYQIYVQSNTKANDLESRKTETRRVLVNLEVNDTPQNKYWLECLKNARYPERRESSQATTENVKPVHDWTSHNRTMTEYFAVNFRYDKEDNQPTGFTFQKAFAIVKSLNHNRDVIGNE